MMFERRVRALAPALLLALLLGACTPAAQPPSEQDVADDADREDAGSNGDISGGTLRFGLSIDPVSIDPRFIVDDEGELVVGALFDPLVQLDEDLQPVPAAAARWDVDDNGKVFTFHLRAAEFHDGSPVTAEAFRRTFARIVDQTAEPVSFLSYLLAPVQGFDEAQSGGELRGVEVVDDDTLVIRLSEPQPAFLETLANPSLVPVPAAADADPEAFALQPVGNGPFRMTEPREPGAFLRMSRYPGHDRPPLLDEVVFQIYAGDQARSRQWDDVVSGQLHVAEIPPERMDEAIERFGESSDGYTGPGLVNGVTSSAYLYGFDTTAPPFDDPRVRRAISMAIDREALADEVLHGARVPASAIVPPPIRGAQPGACGHCRHDPEAAAELFAKAVTAVDEEDGPFEPVDHGDAESLDEGLDEDEKPDGPTEGGEESNDSPDVAPPGNEEASDDPVEGTNPEEGEADDETGAGGAETGEDPQSPASEGPPLETLTLTHNHGRTHTAIADRMAMDIESALGIEVEFRARSLQSFLQSVRRGEVAFFRLGWDGDTPTPAGFLYPLFHSSQAELDNLMRYTNAEVDALLDDARANPDPSKALAQYQEAERLILEDASALPLLWYRHLRVVAPEVQNLRISPLGRVSFSGVALGTSG